MSKSPEQFGPAATEKLRQHAINKAVEHLMGMVEGMVCDGHLHDREIQLLSTWLSENEAACATWPTSAIARLVRTALADGVITEAERDHLMANLQMLLSNEFAITGSASPEVAGLPIEDAVTVRLLHAAVCHTGEFLFGTRAACERATLAVGAIAVDDVSRRVDYLVLGTRVSPNWAHTSFGRKIQRAKELQEQGHAIEIISERRWLKALDAATAV